MPQVKKRLAIEVPGITIEQLDPDQCVAKGAAIYGSNVQIKEAYEQAIADTLGENVSSSDVDALSVEQKDQIAQEALKNLPGNITLAAFEDGRTQEIVNACSKNFGVVTFDTTRGISQITFIIFKNDPVPSKVPQKLVTIVNNQREMIFPIVEANGDNLEESVDIAGAPNSPNGYELPPYALEIGTMTLDLPPTSCGESTSITSWQPPHRFQCCGSWKKYAVSE